MSSEEKISSFIEIAAEVAARNRYKYDLRLSHINSNEAHQKRQIYTSEGKEQVYLSVDTENGGFEVFDNKLNYLNQYKFNGDFDKKSDPINHWIVLKNGDHRKKRKR